MNSKDIDFQRLNHIPPQVISFLQKRFAEKKEMSQYKTLHVEDDLTKYGQQTEVLSIPFPVSQVWKAYTAGHPSENWAGPMVNFIFAYAPATDSFLYPDTQLESGMSEGMQFYCWLNILGPRLVIGLKLMKLDPEARIMEIAYIEGGLYKGLQRLEFKEAPADSTQIIHQSYFKSNSQLRDLILYPFFHRMTVGEFHRKKAQLLESSGR